MAATRFFDRIEEVAGLTLVLDTETYPNYFLLSFQCAETDRIIYFEISPDTDYFDKYAISTILHKNKTIGFNSIKYDLPMIWLAYHNPDIAILRKASDDLIFSGDNAWSIAKKYDFKIYPTDHIDLIEVCPLKGSLKTYGARLHARHLQDLPFDPSQPLTAAQAAIVRDYNFNDLSLTKLIYINLKDQLSLRETLSAEYGINLMSKSDAQIAEAVIGSELKRITGEYPQKPKVADDFRHTYNVPSFVKFQTNYLNSILNIVKSSEYKFVNGSAIVPEAIKNLKIKIGNSIYRMGNGGLHSSEKNEYYETEPLDRPDRT